MKARITVKKMERLEERINCDCCGKGLLKAHYLSNGDTVGSECAQEIEMTWDRIRYDSKPYPWTLPAVIRYCEKLEGKM